MNCLAALRQHPSDLPLNHPSCRTSRIALAYLACAFLCLLMSMPLRAAEETARPAAAYTVELDGAGNLTGFLNQNLDLIGKIKEPGLSADEFQRLAGAANRQIRELLATEGYFSPKVEHTVEQTDERWIARFRIEPGAPTLIDKVDLRLPATSRRIRRHSSASAACAGNGAWTRTNGSARKTGTSRKAIYSRDY